MVNAQALVVGRIGAADGGSGPVQAVGRVRGKQLRANVLRST
jgi:hypothetical protein